MLIIFIVVSLIFGPYWWIYRPIRAELEIKQSRLESLKRTMMIESRKLSNRAKLEREHKEMLARLQRSQDYFIRAEEEIDKAIYLNDLSLETGINLISLKPDRLRTDQIYTKIPYRLEIRGDYDSILDYVEGISKVNYLTRINNLNIRSSVIPDEELQVNIELTTFSLDQLEGGVR